MKFSVFHESRKGARTYNQDRIGHWNTRESLLLVVADGMGGHLHGEVAAQVAVETLGGDFQKDARPRISDPSAYLQRAIGRMHSAIVEHAARSSLPESPRTTLVACIVQDGQAWWTHLGDSRLYLVRNASIVTRTRDHTLVQQLVDQGRIREEAVSVHPERNVVLQCLGGDHVPRAGPTASARLAKDDILLLCSDGFWGPLSQRQLLGALTGRDMKRAIPGLMTLAETRAGPECDNLSTLAICWHEEPAAARTDSAPVTVPSGEMSANLQANRQATGSSAPAIENAYMSDEDITRAIADIKLALDAQKRQNIQKNQNQNSENE